MSQKRLRLFILTMAVIAHVLAYIQFHFCMIPISLPPEWEGQFCFLLTISAVLVIMVSFARNQTIVWLILFIRSIILLVICLPLGSYLGVEQTMMIPLIIETIEYTSLWRGVIFASVLGLIVIGVHLKPIVVWGQLLPASIGQDLWSFGITLVLTISMGAIFYYQQKNHVPKMEINRLFHEATFQLAQVNMQLQEYATSAEQEAVVNERKRLARDLHDILAYTLTNLIMMLEEAKDLAIQGGNVLQEHLENACSQTKEGLADLRQALKALRPTDLTVTTGLVAIHQLVTVFNKATQIEIDLNLGNVPLNFGEEAELVAYRLVQEGMTNALRHGRAKKIFISFTLINDGISIHIKDNGIGAEYTQEGYGLLGMRERIERLGGKLEVASQLGAGFRLLAWIPIQ